MKYSVKNFRVFDNNGVTVDLAPITILTGCNSSGKSSIAKSLLLLDSFLLQIKEDIEQERSVDLSNKRIDFTKYPYNLLGSFNKVLNRKSKNGLVTIEYTIPLPIYRDDVTIRLEFGADKGDELNNAFLHGITFFDSKGNIIMANGRANWSIVSSHFFEFLFQHYKQKRFIKRREELIYAVNRIPDVTVIEKSKQCHSIHAFYILEWLSECTCENIEEVLYSYIPESDMDKELSQAVRILLWDFVNSGCSNFLEYYLGKENERFFNDDSCSDLHVNVSPDTFIINREKYSVGGILPHISITGVLKEKIIKKGITEEQYIGEYLENNPLGFSDICFVLSKLEKIHKAEEQTSFTYDDYDFTGWPYTHHYIADAFAAYMYTMTKQALSPSFVGITYIGSSRVSVRRTYMLDDNNDFALLLKRHFEAKRLSESAHVCDLNNLKTLPEGVFCPEFALTKPYSFMNRWLRKFDIAHHISIQKVNDGVSIYLYNDEDDNEGELLAEKGYGITQLVSILLEIETRILSIRRNNCNKKHLIAIEEPEIHLHPKFQSMLADMFLEAYQKYNIHFIIETHSEYLIRRTQVITSEQRYEFLEELNEKNPFRVYYIDKDSLLYDMCYRTNGLFTEKFGEGFMDEASKLHMMLLKNDRRQ